MATESSTSTSTTTTTYPVCLYDDLFSLLQWVVMESYDGTISIVADRMRLTIPNGDGRLIRVAFGHRMLPGDFDVQIDIPEWSTTDDKVIRASFIVTSKMQDSCFHIGVDVHGVGISEEFFVTRQINLGGHVEIARTANGDIAFCKLRIKRVGTILYGYADYGEGWKLIGYADMGIYSDALTYLNCKISEQDNVGGWVDFDNLHFNLGICPDSVGWTTTSTTSCSSTTCSSLSTASTISTSCSTLSTMSSTTTTGSSVSSISTQSTESTSSSSCSTLSTLSTMSSTYSSSSSCSTLSTLSSVSSTSSTYSSASTLSTLSTSSSTCSTVSSESTASSTTSTHTTTSTSICEVASIRELVIHEVETKLKEISLANGYRNDITTIGIGKIFWSKQDLTAISILPGMESPRRYQSTRSNSMNISIVGFVRFDPKTEEASIKGEPLLADLIHNIVGPTFTIAFSYGKNVPIQGDRLRGQTSNATVVVMHVDFTSGSWVAGTAGGTFRVRDMRGILRKGETLVDDNGTIIASAQLVTIQPKYGGYVSNVDYVTGGIQGYPEAGEDILAVSTTFSFIYMTLNDNPYLMP